MKERIYSLLKFLIGWPFSLLAFFFIVKTIAPQTATIITHLTNLHVPLFVTGIGSLIIFYGIRSYLWHRLLKGFGYKLRFKDACYLWATSELKRYIPGNIWSFLGRTMLFSEKGVTKKDIAYCLVFEAELFIIGAVIVSVLALPLLLPQINWSFTSLSGFGFFALLIGLVSIYVFNRTIFRKLPEKLLYILFPPYHPSDNFLLIGLSTVALVFFGLGNYLVIGSFLPLHPQTVTQLTGFFVFSFLVGYLSILTPAGFGVREGIIIWGLSKTTTVSTAAFAALFSRIVLIFSEIIFIALAFFWYTTKNKTLSQIERWISRHKQESVLAVCSFFYTLYFTTISFLRYDNYYTGRFDLGNMAQTVWNTTQGRIFLFTNPDGTETVSRLAFHADFFLILLTPFYAIWPDPRNLLLLQTIIVAAGAFFVFLLAQTILKNKNIAFVFSFAYLLNPSIQRANLYDFHSATVVTTFLLGAYYFYLKKRYVYFLLFAILAAICKEQLWVIVGLFGAFLFIQQKKRLLGSILFVSSFSIFYFLVSYAIPNSLGNDHFALSYYAEFGDSPAEIIKTMIFSPHKIFDIVLQPDRIDYLKQIFSPLGYLSILAPISLIFAGPELLINLLSNNDQMHQIYYQYTAAISPFLFIAAIQGVALIKKLFPTIPLFVFSCYLLFTSFYAAFLFGPLPGAKEPNLDMITRPLNDRAYIDNYLMEIPQEAKVAASNNLGSHLSHREHIYALPLGSDKADIIVFLLNNSEPPQSVNAQKELLKKLKADPNFTLTVERGDFAVFIKKEK